MLLRRIAWISAVVIMFCSVVLRIAWSARSVSQGTAVGIGFAFVLILTAAFATVILGLLAALVPWKGLGYPRRLWLRLPFALFAVCLASAGAALLPEWYESKQGMRPVPGSVFSSTPAAPDEACLSVHDGVFGTEGIRIERHGDVQYQRDNVLGQEEHLTVRWRNACEYELLDADSLLGRIVKITKVDSTGYDCLVTYTFDSTHAYALRLDHLR